MHDEKTLSIDELVAGIWRHKLLALAVAGGVIALGALYAFLWPRTYVSSTVVRIEAQRLPEQYVAPTVTERIEQRLAAVRHELLSRPVLGKVIEELDLYAQLRADEGLDAAVARMRSNLEVRVEGENVFAVSFEANDPALAQRVVARIPEIYVAQAQEERARDAERAAQIFAAEMEELAPQVASVERQLTEFKAKNAGRLPEILEANLRQLDRLSGLTETALTALADAQRRRTALARLGAESSAEAARRATAAHEAQRELATLEARYTGNHPEVAAARRSAEEAQRRFDQASRHATEGDSEFSRLDSEIRWLADTARGYQGRMEEYLRRVDETPAVGAEMAGLTREYEALREKYQTLLSRKIEAELAQDLERRQRASLFRIVEPALVPSRAAKPDPVQALGVSIVLGLGLGIAAASYRASRDTSLRSPTQARRELGIPVLAAIPDLERRSPRAGA